MLEVGGASRGGRAEQDARTVDGRHVENQPKVGAVAVEQRGDALHRQRLRRRRIRLGGGGGGGGGDGLDALVAGDRKVCGQQRVRTPRLERESLGPLPVERIIWRLSGGGFFVADREKNSHDAIELSLTF